MDKKIQEEIKESPEKDVVAPEKAEPAREIMVSPEETERILDQLFEQGYATTTIEVVPNRASAVIRSLRADDQLELEEFMGSVSGSSAYVLHMYSKKLMVYTLDEYKDEKMTSETVESIIGKLTSSLLHKMVTAQNYFERQVRKATKVDEIDKYFFGTPSTPEE